MSNSSENYGETCSHFINGENIHGMCIALQPFSLSPILHTRQRGKIACILLGQFGQGLAPLGLTPSHPHFLESKIRCLPFWELDRKFLCSWAGPLRAESKRQNSDLHLAVTPDPSSRSGLSRCVGAAAAFLRGTRQASSSLQQCSSCPQLVLD